MYFFAGFRDLGVEGFWVFRVQDLGVKGLGIGFGSLGFRGSGFRLCALRSRGRCGAISGLGLLLLSSAAWFSTIVSLGIIFYFCSYKAQENINNIMLLWF